jgi:hypothetical protein
VSPDSRGLNIVAHLKDLAVFCTAYMKHLEEVWREMVDRLGKRVVSATPMRKCSPSYHVPLSEKSPDRSPVNCWQIVVLIFLLTVRHIVVTDCRTIHSAQNKRPRYRPQCSSKSTTLASAVTLVRNLEISNANRPQPYSPVPPEAEQVILRVFSYVRPRPSAREFRLSMPTTLGTSGARIRGRDVIEADLHSLAPFLDFLCG